MHETRVHPQPVDGRVAREDPSYWLRRLVLGTLEEAAPWGELHRDSYRDRISSDWSPYRLVMSGTVRGLPILTPVREAVNEAEELAQDQRLREWKAADKELQAQLPPCHRGPANPKPRRAFGVSLIILKLITSKLT